MLFGPDDGLEFAWLPSVPEGKVEGTYTVDGETRHASGVGYHDHNWGNVSPLKVIHDWYWARGHAGPYSVIASYITAHERYGYSAIPILMIAKDGRIVADDATQGPLRDGGAAHRPGHREARRRRHPVRLRGWRPAVRRDVHSRTGPRDRPDDRNAVALPAGARQGWPASTAPTCASPASAGCSGSSAESSSRTTRTRPSGSSCTSATHADPRPSHRLLPHRRPRRKAPEHSALAGVPSRHPSKERAR